MISNMFILPIIRMYNASIGLSTESLFFSKKKIYAARGYREHVQYDVVQCAS
jgi:hypothetical protein